MHSTHPRIGTFITLTCLLGACGTAGSSWMEEPLVADGTDDESPVKFAAIDDPAPPEKAQQDIPRQPGRRVLGGERRKPGDPVDASQLSGKVIGSFRNTYYDFPSEADYSGPPTALKNGSCETIKMVPKTFHDTLCVQGSGTLLSGQTVSFHKRDCGCASLCPRTDQKICFDALDATRFPWGRGATGGAITPLLTVAVDPTVIPMGTALYIPELDGMPIDHKESGLHDGCFIAQDKGLKVKGKHIDFFTGDEHLTRLWNSLVPSNKGVTVVTDSPRCERVGQRQVPAKSKASESDSEEREKKNKKKKKKR